MLCCAVVTLGSRGALLLAAGDGPDDATLVPAAPLPPGAAVVDTTGAGDCFSGSLAYFYTLLARARGITAATADNAATVDRPTLVEAMRRASFVASISVTRKGTQTSFPDRASLPPALFELPVPGGSADGAVGGLRLPTPMPAKGLTLGAE